MAVEIGQVAPDFILMDGDRKKHTLSEYRGQTVVVAWYVLAFTGGWTNELSRFRELHDEFQEAGAQVLGISVDSPFANGAYAIELGLEFPLLGDFPWGKTGKAWGILNEERGITSRMTYVIDAEGVVQHIIDAPRDFHAHPEGALEFVKGMSG